MDEKRQGMKLHPHIEFISSKLAFFVSYTYITFKKMPGVWICGLTKRKIRTKAITLKPLDEVSHRTLLANRGL